MQVEVKLAGLEYYDLEDLREDNYEWDLSLHELREDYYDGDKIFKYEYPDKPIQVALEPDNEHDPDALAVYLCDKKIGYVAKSQKKTVMDLHGMDVSVWAEIDGGPVKILWEDEDEKLQVDRDDYPLRGKLVFVENKHFATAPPSEPPKPKTLPPVIFYLLGALLLILSLVVLIIKPVTGVLGIVGGILVLLYGRKMKRLRDGSKT